MIFVPETPNKIIDLIVFSEKVENYFADINNLENWTDFTFNKRTRDKYKSSFLLQNFHLSTWFKMGKTETDEPLEDIKEKVKQLYGLHENEINIWRFTTQSTQLAIQRASLKLRTKISIEKFRKDMKDNNLLKIAGKFPFEIEPLSDNRKKNL